MVNLHDGRRVSCGDIAWDAQGEVAIGTHEDESISSRLSGSFIKEGGRSPRAS